MTDLATIKIPVDSSDMLRAVKDSKSLERGIKMLVDSFGSGAIGSNQFKSGLSQLSKEFKDLFTNYRQATTRVRGFASALIESKAATDAATASKKALTTATQKAETAFALANQKAKEEIQLSRARADFAFAMGVQRAREADMAVAAAAKEAMEVERLRLKYDQIYASSQLYSRSLTELKSAHILLGWSTNQHEAAVESLNLEYQNFQNGIAQVGNRFSQHVNQTASGMNKFGMAAQQTGYQVSDFLVQIQGGTNPLVAFSQQATQLTGLLYIMSPALLASRLSFVAFSISMSTAIAAVTIAVPLLAMLAMAFASSGKESDKAAKGVDKQTEALDALIEKVNQLRLARQMDASGITSKEEQVVQNNLNELLDQRSVLQERVNKLEVMGGKAAGFEKQSRDKLALLQLVILANEAAIKAITYEQELEAAAKRRANESRNAYREAFAALQSQIVATNNQRSADAARAQERLAAEKQYRSLVNEAQSKDQYWLNQAKAAERQQIAVQHIMNTLSLLAVREDSEGFNKAIEAALAAGVHFSQVDLSSIVAMAAKHGWSLVDAIRAAWAASQGGPVVNANSSMGPNFEGGGRMGSTSAPYIPPALTLDEVIKRDLDKAGGGGDSTQSAIEELQKQLAVEKELLGTSEAYQKVHQALGDEFKTTSPEIIAGLVQQATEIEHLIALEEQRKQIIDTVSSSVENALMSMVDGTQSVKDAFRSMASEIIKELYRIYVVQQIVGFVTDAVSGGMGFFSAPSTGTGGLPFGGELAVGGPIDPGAAYLVGEKGPELVVPRSSGTVMTASQTANALSGGGSGAVTVNNNITVTGSDAAMVRAEVSKMIPQITNVTKAAVIDARLRGGQMKQAFR